MFLNNLIQWEMESSDIYSNPREISAETCSCANCDSYHCFALRYQQEKGCFCKECNDCPLYKNLKAYIVTPQSDFDTKDTKLESSHTNETKDLELESPKTVEFKSSNPKSKETPSAPIVTVHDTTNDIEETRHSESSLLNTHESPETYCCYDQSISRKESPFSKKLKLICSIGATNDTDIEKINQSIDCIKEDHNSCIFNSIKSIRNCPKAKIFIQECVKKEMKNYIRVMSHTQRNLETKESREREQEQENKINIERNNLKKTADISTSISEFIHKIKNFFGNATPKQSTTSKIEYENDKIGSSERQNDNISNIKHHVQEIEKQLLELDKQAQRKSDYSSKAELAAQIMNVPLKEYEETLNAPKARVKIDLIKRIKEIYDACSCDHCKCIPTKSEKVYGNQGDDECQDIKEIQRKKGKNCVNIVNGKVCNTKIFESNHNCSKNILEANLCNCEPCECVACSESVKKQCLCKSCECIQCKSLGFIKKSRIYTVAPISEEQRPPCTCAPCGCFACANPFGRINQNQNTHEMGTRVSHHNNCPCEPCGSSDCEQSTDACNCVRNPKVMSKPVVKDTKEYDIHIAATKNSILNNKTRGKRNSYTTCDTITMFASIPQHRKMVGISPKCNVQWCPDVMPVIKLNEEYLCNKIEAELMKTEDWREPCDCKPCECNKCKTHFLEGHIPSKNKNCLCEICDCINCATLSVKYDMENKYKRCTDMINLKEICKCKPCECMHCRKYIINYPYPKHPYPEITTDENGGYSSILTINETRNYTSLVKVTDSERFIDLVLTDKESKNRPDEQKTYTKDPQNFWERNNIVECSLCPNKLNSSATFANESYSVSIKSTKSKEADKVKQNEYESEIQQIQSLETSAIEGSSTIKRFDRKSYISSCDSAGRDCSDFLIHFPTTTVETCIKDVMNFNSYGDSDISCSKADVTPKLLSECSSFSRMNIKNIPKINESKQNNKACNESVTKVNSETKKCKNSNLGKPGEFKSSSFDSCVFKIPKPETCRCDCKDTCLSDKVIWIRKNETTQTFILPKNEKAIPDIQNNYFCNSINNFRRLTQFSLNQDSEKYKKSTVTFSEVGTKCINSDFITNKPLNDKLKTYYSVFNNRDPFHVSVNKINYKSIEKTIKDARQFSLELLKILAKYQKANKEFNSVTEKYKHLHESLCLNEMILLDDNKEKTKKNEENIINSDVGNGEKVNDVANVLIAESDSLEKCKKYPNSNLINEKTSSQYNKKLKVDKFHKDTENTCGTVVNNENRPFPNMNVIKEIHNNGDKYNTTTPCKDSVKEIQTNNENNRNNAGMINLEELKKEFRNYSDTLSKAIKRCKQGKWKQLTEISNTQIKMLDQDLCKNEKHVGNVQVENFKSRHECNKGNVSNQNTMKLDDYKKCASKSTKKTNVMSKDSSIDSDKEGTLPSKVAIQDRYESSPVVAAKTWKISNTVRGSMTTNTSALKQRSSDPQRVVFDNIRRISDHTVLLKWKVPEDTVHVLGYELLVDGHSVQKIMSPVRTMAVLTCLPPLEKVLFTVRTLISDQDTRAKNGHVPCASYLYNLVKQYNI